MEIKSRNSQFLQYPLKPVLKGSRFRIFLLFPGITYPSFTPLIFSSSFSRCSGKGISLLEFRDFGPATTTFVPVLVTGFPSAHTVSKVRILCIVLRIASVPFQTEYPSIAVRTAPQSVSRCIRTIIFPGRYDLHAPLPSANTPPAFEYCLLQAHGRRPAAAPFLQQNKMREAPAACNDIFPPAP